MQDYVMRLIQQVAQMVAAIMGHRNAGRRPEAQQEIDRLCLQTAGLPLALIKQASPEALRAFLPVGGPQRMARDILLAELLLQDADLNGAEDPTAAAHLRAHAFCLIHDHLHALGAEDRVHYTEKLDGLAQSLGGTPADRHVADKVNGWLQRNDGAVQVTG